MGLLDSRRFDLTSDGRNTSDEETLAVHRGRHALHPAHRRCGELAVDVMDGRMWMTCECGASLSRPLLPADKFPDQHRRIAQPEKTIYRP